MKIAGVWLCVLGYTLMYVGWSNENGKTISLYGALSGQTPTPTNPSAGGGGILGFLGSGLKLGTLLPTKYTGNNPSMGGLQPQTVNQI